MYVRRGFSFFSKLKICFVFAVALQIKKFFVFFFGLNEARKSLNLAQIQQTSAEEIVEPLVAITQAFSWDVLTQMINNDQVDYLGREHNHQEKYKQSMKDIRSHWASVSEYLLVRFYGYSYEVSPTGVNKAGQPPQGYDKSKFYNLVLNDYPYV